MGGASRWNPDYHAVSVVSRPDPGGRGPMTISVRHPDSPCNVALAKGKTRWSLDSSDICGLVNSYLMRLTELSGADRIPPIDFSIAASDANLKGDVQELVCLPLEDSASPWKTSFWFDRSYPGSKEHTLVILAAPESLRDECTKRRGVRVIAHVDEARGGLRFVSMSAYLPPGETIRVSSPAVPRATEVGLGPVNKDLVMLEVKEPIDPVSHPSRSGISGDDHSLAMRRPTGKEEILDQYRSPYLVTDSDFADIEYVLHHPSNFARKDIESGLVRHYLAGQCAGSAKPAPPDIGLPPLRSDDCSDYQAYFNANLLFYLFKRVYIRPESYFRSATLPLDIHYRSGMPYGPGRDGQTVNAAVQPGKQKCTNSDDPPPDDQTWRRHQIAPKVNQEPPPLHVHFALANRSHRGRRPWTGERRSPAEPMGIVNDPRWVLHEFGHVLLMATTGELEMRFAHSIGDALAAIVADPISGFAWSGEVSDEEKERNRRWRGVTFPWVYLPRRHDRSVKRGWSWSGAMHRPLRTLPDAKQPRRKGYRSEQILSTSLFRLYLCLGGLTPNADGLQRRLAASEYALYLIVKGLGLLGDARIVPANHPDQLVSALIDADIGTEAFGYLPARWPGGFAHKVIRWAFEAQGLYAGGSIDNNGIGEPPPVDVYIKDHRPLCEEWCGGVDHDAGSYVPVPLEDPVHGPCYAPPAWFSDAISVTDKKIEVEVGNRGREVAADVEVRVFYTQWDGRGLPVWDPDNVVAENDCPVAAGTWVEAGFKKGATTHGEIASKESLSFGPFDLHPTHGARYLILAEASCAADRANTDPVSLLSCSREPMPLVDLVANDNNLGLTLWTFSTIQPGKRRRRASR